MFCLCYYSDVSCRQRKSYMVCVCVLTLMYTIYVFLYYNQKLKLCVEGICPVKSNLRLELWVAAIYTSYTSN